MSVSENIRDLQQLESLQKKKDKNCSAKKKKERRRQTKKLILILRKRTLVLHLKITKKKKHAQRCKLITAGETL